DPAGEHLPHAVPDELAAPVELGQRLDAPPGLVVAGLRVEVVHGAFGGVHVGDGGGEPGVGVAGVVGGDVAEQPHTPPVQRGGQQPQGGVAAEQRVDVIEGGGVVAVVGAGGEDRGEVDGVGAEALDVVEVADDAVEVAAVELLGGAGTAGDNRVAVPVAGQRPVRQVGHGAGAGEPVRSEESRAGNEWRYAVVSLLGYG